MNIRLSDEQRDKLQPILSRLAGEISKGVKPEQEYLRQVLLEFGIQPEKWALEELEYWSNTLFRVSSDIRERDRAVLELRSRGVQEAPAILAIDVVITAKKSTILSVKPNMIDFGRIKIGVESSAILNVYGTLREITCSDDRLQITQIPKGEITEVRITIKQDFSRKPLKANIFLQGANTLTIPITGSWEISQTVAETKKAPELKDDYSDSKELSRLSRIEQAVPHIKKAAELKDDDIGYHWLGKTLSELGRFEEALPYFRKAVQLNGDELNYHWLGKTLSQSGRYEEALSYLKKAVDLKGEDVDYYWLGLSLYQLRRYEEALLCFQKTIVTGGDGEDYNWLGSTLSQLKRYKEALPYLKKAVELRGNGDDYNWLGATLFQLENYEEALPYLERAVELRGEAIDYRWFGITLYQLNRYQEALPQLRRVVKSTGDTNDNDWLELCEEKMKNN